MKFDRNRLVLGLVLSVIIALYAGNAGAVDFKLGEFSITMNPPETVDHISYASDPYDDIEVNTATIKDLFLTYKVTILKSLSEPVEEFKSTPIPGYYDSLSDTKMDGKSAVMILANKFTTVEYVKDDKTLITLRFEEAEGTDSSNSIAETIKSFKATRA